MNVVERTVFTLGLAILLLPCFLQMSPCFSRVLSCYFFQMVSFFAYPIFMIHYIFVIGFLFSNQRNGVTNMNSLVILFVGFLAISIVASVFA